MCHCKPCSKCSGKLLRAEDIKSYFSSLAKIRKNKGVQIPPGLQTREQALMSLLLDTLKQKCRELCIPVSGRKAQLVQRIMDAETVQRTNVNNSDETQQTIDGHNTVNL